MNVQQAQKIQQYKEEEEEKKGQKNILYNVKKKSKPIRVLGAECVHIKDKQSARGSL